MAGGALAPTDGGQHASQYQGKCTLYVVIVAIVAASGGLVLGCALWVLFCFGVVDGAESSSLFV